MQISIFTDSGQLRAENGFSGFRSFVERHPQGNFFQSLEFFQVAENVQEFSPLLLLAFSDSGVLQGSLLGVFQTNGSGLKSWFSRRLVVWGGPLVSEENPDFAEAIILPLLRRMKKYASGRAIFIEFRNFYDMSVQQPVFETCGFEFQPYLNLLVKTDEEAVAFKRMRGNRRREIQNSLKAGAEIVEAQTEEEIRAFYSILDKLYRERVKKPLPALDLFFYLWRSQTGKIFIVKYQGEVVGGTMCPIFNQRIIYDWFHCGITGLEPQVHAGVLAAWAPIAYGLKNGFEYMDFMGGGRPDEKYGVRDFKARYGAEEVAFGRFSTVLNKPLFEVGKIGLKVYQQLK